MDCHSKADRAAFRGLDGRDVAFMERLRNLAREVLTWEHLSDQQRLVWAAALELDAVPVQDGGSIEPLFGFRCPCGFAGAAPLVLRAAQHHLSSPRQGRSQMLEPPQVSLKRL